MEIAQLISKSIYNNKLQQFIYLCDKRNMSQKTKAEPRLKVTP